LKLATCAWRVGRPAGVAGWAQRLDRAIAEARGAELLLLPEYAAMEVAAGEMPDVTAELARATELSPVLLQVAQDAARRHGIWLIPGTMPWAEDGKVVNRAHLVTPDGRVASQDKHAMTRFEAEQWGVSAGRAPAVFETPWGRVGVAICFDGEFPNLVRVQVEAGAWLVLMPSCTDTRHGDLRIRIAARARAMENQCFVAVAPTVGAAPWSASLDNNHGVAAIYGPVDHGFRDDGVVAEGVVDQPGWVFADLDPAAIAAVREHGAVLNHRAWPAAPPPCPVATFA